MILNRICRSASGSGPTNHAAAVPPLSGSRAKRHHPFWFLHWRVVVSWGRIMPTPRNYEVSFPRLLSGEAQMRANCNSVTPHTNGTSCCHLLLRPGQGMKIK